MSKSDSNKPEIISSKVNPDAIMPESLKAALQRPPSTENGGKPTFGPREQNWATLDMPYLTVRNGHVIATAEKTDVQGVPDLKRKDQEEGPVSEKDVKADIEPSEGVEEGK